MEESPRTLPDFFIVGAPKAGTTALYSYLRDHPRVFMPDLKEPHYFSEDLPGLREVRSREDYAALFAPAPEGAILGEASASYLQSQVAVPRILEQVPAARLIVMLRNPVELAHAFHAERLYNLGEDEEDFESAWRLQDVRAAGRRIPPRCGEPGLLQYRDVCALGTQLERFMARVPEDQRRIIVFDDFKAGTGVVYREVLDFLGLPDDGRREFGRENASKALRSPSLAAVHRRLPDALGRVYGPVKRLGNALGVHPSWIMESLNVVARSRPPVDPAFARELTELFAPEIDKLSSLLGRELLEWQPADNVVSDGWRLSSNGARY